jgi:large subunit ribosomal protein L3
MINGILGKKIGMTQVFDDKGDVHPVTVLQAGPCVITQIKRNNKEGYEAAQIGLVEFVKGKNVSKAMQGHFGKHDLPPVKFMREVAMQDGTEAATAEGQPAEGEAAASNGDGLKVGGKVLVDIFTNEKFVDVIGVSKGRGFAGVVKRQVAVRNLAIRGIDIDDNLLLVEGAVPGPKGAYVVILKAKKPPRERRGFAGSTTLDPLKAAKKAAAGKGKK